MLNVTYMYVHMSLIHLSDFGALGLGWGLVVWSGLGMAKKVAARRSRSRAF